MSLKKYFTFIPLSLKRFLSYRVNIIGKILSAPLSMLVIFVLWNAIYSSSNTETIGYFTKEQMLSYSILAVIFSTVISSNADDELGDLICWGNFVVSLAKPMQYYWAGFFSEVGEKISGIITVSLPSLLFGIFIFGLKQSSIIFTFLSVTSLVFAYLINYSFSMLFGLIAFRVTNYGKFNWFKLLIVSFFSGSYISLSLFPAWFQNSMTFLPFQHIIYTPVRIFIGSYSVEQSIFFIIIQAFWAVALFFAFKFGWKRAIKRFEGAGA